MKVLNKVLTVLTRAVLAAAIATVTAAVPASSVTSHVITVAGGENSNDTPWG